MLTATSAADLPRVSELLHDAWLDLPEAGQFDPPRTVTMSGFADHGDRRVLRSFGPLVRVEETKPQVVLSCRSVLAVSVEDEARIGSLNVASVRFDDVTSQVVIEGHVPATVFLTVAALDVEVV
jgi:hypothetical protein